MPPPPPPSHCLCIFDMDRTLTGHQGRTAPQCPGNQVQHGIRDWAYGGGELTLSRLALGLSATSCGRNCYVGVLTAGKPSAQQAQNLWGRFNALPFGLGGGVTSMQETPWLEASSLRSHTATTPLIVHAHDGRKQEWVRNILLFYREHAHVAIRDERVFFFDDRSSNVLGFAGTPWNARQVSCASREGSTGGCGGKPEEISAGRGVKLCGETTCRGAHQRKVACPT